jgi:hypothetical protein
VHDHGVRISITLVHGTWPKGILPSPSRLWGGSRYWFEPGSNFWNCLLQSLKSRGLSPSSSIKAFSWSGANSILERDRAAHNLARLLVDERRSDHELRQWIVAHSHGGNVALRALQILPKDFTSISVTTIATPFVELRPKKAAAKEWQSLRKARQHFNWFSPLTYILWRLTGFLDLRLLRRQRRLQSASSLRGFGTGLFQHRLFVLRAIDDEAALALAAGAIANRVLSSFSLLLMFGIMVFSFSMPLLLIMGMGLLGADQFAWGDWLQYLFGLTPQMIVAAMLCYFIAAAFHAVYGRELWLGCHRFDLNAQSVPDQIGRSTFILTLPQIYGRKRHMLYNAPECADLIVSWFALDEPGEGSSQHVQIPAITSDVGEQNWVSSLLANCRQNSGPKR